MQRYTRHTFLREKPLVGEVTTYIAILAYRDKYHGNSLEEHPQSSTETYWTKKNVELIFCSVSLLRPETIQVHLLPLQWLPEGQPEDSRALHAPHAL